MKYLIGLLLIGMFFFVLVVPFYLDPILQPSTETFAKFLKQKTVDCNICLRSQYTSCHVPDKDCWVLIDNIHQVCYQNCTIEMRN